MASKSNGEAGVVSPETTNAALPPGDEKQNASDSPALSDRAEPVAETKTDTDTASSHGFKWWFAYASVLSTVLLFAIDGTIVADIQPSIVDSLGEVDKLPWIGVAISLGTVAILPHGKALGIFNVKWYFLAMVFGFEVGSAICGAAPTMNVMIGGRFIQGFFGCGVYAGGLTVVAMSTTNRERALYFSGIVAVYGIGSVIGPVIGGAFAESAATWRWSFYINLVVFAAFLPGFLFCIPSLNPVDLPFKEKVLSQDWVGFLIWEAGTACYAMALTFGGIYYPFNSGSEIALWVVTAVLLIVFVLVTIYHPFVSEKNRLYPAHFVKRYELMILQYMMFACAGTMYTAIYYTPLIFQFTRGDGPLQAGVRLLPLMCMLVFFSILNGALMPRLRYYAPWYIFGNSVILAGSTLMFTLDTTTSDSAIYGYTALIGMGVGSFLTASVAIAQAMVDASDSSNAVGALVGAQNVGAITFLGVSGSIYGNVGVKLLGQVLPDMPAADLLQLTTGTHSPLYESLSAELQSEISTQVTFAIRDSFGIVVAASALGFIASLFLIRHKVY
ncbi:putative Major facilitator superfamily (MFS) profile domain-containing protein [Seiridium cardinale]|uniref:Major facilitator superfamily (MFS) profile domain-containing protein n=1 Tax=Seiridium cardinale TaxID=138064 RepID=A0ABR2XF40_9PEZI